MGASPVKTGEQVREAPQSVEASEAARPRSNLGILFVLCVIGVCSYVDRQVISSLIEPIKREFGVSDSLMGLLTGLSFASFYVVASVPIGRLADNTSRRAVLAVCL